jgi:DDE superfamily endonuclease
VISDIFRTSKYVLLYRYFRQILFTLSSAPFYTRYVFLPSDITPIPDEIRNNSKFYPFFAGALGAIDGTHIRCCPSVPERQSARNRKGGVSQNCLACCSFDLRFQYILSGWDGSAADASVYNDARQSDLPIADNKFYLADAGFGACDGLLVPY